MKRLTEDLAQQSDKAKFSKHTLESDDELEEAELGGRMEEEELKVGQEAETINFDGEIAITPFNLKEELEDDGHFDANGTFIFKKTDEAGDNWLEDVNWSEVRRREINLKSGQKPLENIEAANEALPEINNDQRANLYREVCFLLNARETVLRALKRMGPTNGAKGGALRKKITGLKNGRTIANLEPKRASGDQEGFLRLTELANDLLGSGDFDIYQKTKEVLQDLVRLSERKLSGDNELDALGSYIDGASGFRPTDDAIGMEDSPKWILKKGASADTDSEIEGPYCQSDVWRWLSQGIFSQPERVFVKRQGSSDQFESLATISFKKT